MRTVLAALAAAPLVASPALASGLCAPTGGDAKPPDAIIQMLQEKGYRKIKELERGHGCHEAMAHDAQGGRVELYVHPNAGEIVKAKGGAS